VSTASLYLGLARQYGGRAHIVYSLADLHFVRLARQAKAQGRPELAVLSERLRQAELLAASAANAVITHSDVEANYLRERIKGCNVHVVPWAVPVRDSNKAWSDRRDMAFIGNFAHDPNPDAARFLTTRIMPRVLRKKPNLRCLLVGRHMSEIVRRLAGSGIDIVGHVPQLATVLDQVRLTVAPLRFGAGVKGKVLESLAAGVPCVMSPVAAEGIALPSELKALVADDEERMADLIVHLNDSEGDWSALSACATAFMAENYSEANVLAGMRAAINGNRTPNGIALSTARTGGDVASTSSVSAYV
jgi:glycosyltransferase involved in cell wall biosynthesis